MSASCGTGATPTAIANMVDDGTNNGTFKVSSVTMRIRASSTPRIAFACGGEITSAATPGTSTIAANSSGGLTKIGSGTLTHKRG